MRPDVTSSVRKVSDILQRKRVLPALRFQLFSAAGKREEEWKVQEIKGLGEGLGDEDLAGSQREGSGSLLLGVPVTTPGKQI